MNIVVFGGEVGGDVRGSWGLMVLDVPNALTKPPLTASLCGQWQSPCAIFIAQLYLYI